MTDIHILQNGTSNYSYANAVSSDGKVIVGESGVTTNSTHYAFRYDANGIFTNLGNLGSLQSTATGVSADGAVIVGYSATGSGEQIHAFRYASGMMTDLRTLGGNSAKAYGVSADGTVVVGSSQALSGEYHAFRYKGGMMTDLGTLGGGYSIASGVSANGAVIVGSSTIGNGPDIDIAITHAFKLVGGVMTDLGTFGGANSAANGVSANGAVIVGQSDTIFGVSHAFIYRNIMVDVPNTYTALGTNAGQLAGLLNVRHAVLGLALQDECNSYSVRNVCVSAGGRSSRVEGGFTDTAAQLQLGYRISPQLRIGASLDQGVSTSTPFNYTVTRSQPLVALYAAYALTGTTTGLQLKASVAQGSDDVGITRSVVAHTEAGHGNSALTVKGMQLEAGWGWTLGRWQAMSFAGVKDMRLSRAAYTETSGADFPVSYQAVRQSATTAYAGLQASSELAANLMINLRGGVEHDLRNHQDLYVGTIESLSPFAIAAPTVQRTRAFAAVSSAYRITPTQQLSIGVHYSQQPLQQANGVTVMVRYSAAL
jgi:probable HAF family extracellular repeat protein